MSAYRDTYSMIDLSALKDNLHYIHETSKKPLMAIVKADAYGHGAIQVARIASFMPYVEMFGVATLGEAIELREQGITKGILVLGAICEKDLYLASQYDISICLYSLDYLQRLILSKQSLKVHIKIDTGMNRLGFKSKEDFEKALKLIQNNPAIIAEGVFTHYGAADEPNDTYDRQFKRFKAIVQNHSFKYIHASNTAGALYHHEDFTNMVRAGIAIYGIEPDGHEDTSLKQVMSLKTKVVMVKQIQKGECVGYGFTYQAQQDEYIATVPIGYADGIIRKNQDRFVYINGHEYQIVGRVCMDQMMLRVDKNVQVGDEVEIFGPHISLNRMASELETIPYEVLCLISLRVERKYID